MSHSHAEVQKQVKIYMMVFGTLLFLTIVTVAISYLHLTAVPAILVALVVASVKGSLVACYFMHLISERKLIYWALLLTVLFFALLMFLPVAQLLDVFAGITY